MSCMSHDTVTYGKWCSKSNLLKTYESDPWQIPETYAMRKMWKSVSSMWHVAVCCSVLQCVAVCCSALQCVAVWRKRRMQFERCERVCLPCDMLQCVAVCCSVLQCVAVCCSVLQCVAVWHVSCTKNDVQKVIYGRKYRFIRVTYDKQKRPRKGEKDLEKRPRKGKRDQWKTKEIF